MRFDFWKAVLAEGIVVLFILEEGGLFDKSVEFIEVIFFSQCIPSRDCIFGLLNLF